MHGASPLGSAAELLLAPRLEQRILPGLDRIRNALEALGHPENAFPSVLIVGTNGKGSTAALLAGIARAHGHRVGLYTSPHLVRVEERIRVDGETIDHDRLLDLVRELGRFPDLSYFETLTAAAFLEFASRGVDLAVLEAGLGGRWDATNATSPSVAMLTNVGTDHQSWLGTTRASIAAEKAAALRGLEAIVGSWDAEVEPAIRATADPASSLTLASQWATVMPTAAARRGRGSDASGTGAPPESQAVEIRTGELTATALLPLAGAHQRDNLRLALAGAAALARHGVLAPLGGDAIARGIAGAFWPGRLQRVSWKGRRLVLDGAHNREATLALASALDDLGLSGEVDLLFSCLNDKPLAEMASLLRPRVRRIHVAALESPRATPAAEIAAAFPGSAVHRDVETALAALPARRTSLVTGSLRLVGAVLAAIGRHDA